MVKRLIKNANFINLVGYKHITRFSIFFIYKINLYIWTDKKYIKVAN